MTDPAPADLLALALATAREAGTLLLRMQAEIRAEISTKSSMTDMVTDADRAAERLIVERIRAVWPDDVILGEEGGDPGAGGGSAVRWVVDPLDGTTNYLYRQPFFAVSIAAEVDGEAVAGVVYDPSHDEAFTAGAGAGAFLNGEAIAVSGLGELATGLVATGFSYSAGDRAQQGPVVARVLPHVRDIRRHGAAALDLCWVACGRLDAYYERGVQVWDWRAGELIVREAGGRTSSIDGGAPGDGSMLAATPGVFEPLGELVRGSKQSGG